MKELIQSLPKTELHVHIEGTLEPPLMFELAGRNGVKLPYADLAALRAAYQFENLQSFLDLYYAGAEVLRTERDFYDLARAYALKAREQNIVHAEIFFDPQSHTVRGIAFECVVQGLRRALEDARRQWGFSSALILCFLRDRPEREAEATLDQALAHREAILGIGLDSAELGNPPEKFARVFRRARAQGFRLVAHAGEEGPPAYIEAALDVLGAERIDHGVRCLEDARLVARLRQARVPLTVCPLSNVRLRVFRDMTAHNLRALLDAGLLVTLNSDDPAYFGGYLNENYAAVSAALPVGPEDCYRAARNGFRAAFLDEASKARFIDRLDRAWAAWRDGNAHRS